MYIYFSPPPSSSESSSSVPPYLLLAGGSAALPRSPVSGLHLQNGAEQLLRCLRQEANLGVGMEAIQVGRLRRKCVINVLNEEEGDMAELYNYVINLGR